MRVRRGTVFTAGLVVAGLPQILAGTGVVVAAQTSAPASGPASVERAAARPPGDAQSPSGTFWTLTTVDGLTRPTAAKAELGDDVLRLSRNVPRRSSGELQLNLRDGNKLPGTPGPGSAGETLGWLHPLLGELSFPLSQVASVERTGRAVRSGAAPPAAGQDVAVLANGDRLLGLVASVSGEGIVMQPAGGDAAAVAWGDIHRLIMTDIAASPTGAATSRPSATSGYFRIELSDGTIFSSPSLLLTDDTAAVRGANDKGLTIGLADVAMIERVGFNAIPLSLLTPTETTHRSYLTAARGPVIDAAANGGPLPTRRGLTLTAYSRVTYPVPAGYGRVTLRYALDASAARGSAVIRVLADDRVIHEGLAAVERTLALDLALGEAKAVTLEVGFGPSAGVLARVNILEPLFRR